MLFQKEGVQINEFILNDKDAYIITYRDSYFWTVDVSRKTGLVSFIKGGILPESVDKFETKRNGQKTEIYLHTKDKFGAHENYIGETDDHATAEAWVSVVNKIYEKLGNNQKLTGE